MRKLNIKRLIFGSLLLGGLITGGAGMVKHSKDKRAPDRKNRPYTLVDDHDADADKTAPDTAVYSPKDAKGNVALFEATRSKIKFSLAFVENFAATPYDDGTGRLTIGYGTTVLYNPNGTHRSVRKTDKVTMSQADVYKGRYLTHDVLPAIKKYVKVPMDENTLITTCVFAYCIGSGQFKESQYLKQLNKGVTGAELAKYLTGWRTQPGLMNRFYFFAALLAGEIEFDDLLDLRAEGCYSLKPEDMAKYNTKQKRYIVDKGNFAIWDFSKIKTNLETAKKPRKSAKLGKCKLVREIVPDYILEDVGATNSGHASATYNKAKTVATSRTR